ncbi:nicotinamide riboside transporter PnuC [Thermoflavimicrobium daqui]|uniref:Nicotinamide mononucleotide transporter PnuC n=1 Tax=Thermoflavimicrobium daqui TaxID=2137476 RepID=A0A364K9C9_9BACL|nr:nicotinamide riboside transporter PnuC [Thermoflavimicrobium daqui]RAL26888.1 nicotinamide mononucleotide transporter PnuC [Thermoflavimicrobium daqui]
MIQHPLFVIIASLITVAVGLYLGSSYIEIFATVMGIINLWLLAKEKVLNFLFGIITVTTFLYIYFTQSLYAMVLLSVFQLAFNVYGWYYWLRDRGNQDVRPTVQMTPKQIGITIVVILIGWMAWSYYEVNYTEVPHPYLDSLNLVISLVAQYLLSKKFLENWHLWILTNIILIITYLITGLYVMIIYSVIGFILCIQGLIEWKKSLQMLKR